MFIEGKLISVAKRPFKTKKAYMAQLHPKRDEVWEIRSRDPKPGSRVFGRFAETDVFVALTWSPREILGGPGSREWKAVIRQCKTEWRQLFPAHQPISGDDLHAYISANVFLV